MKFKELVDGQRFQYKDYNFVVRDCIKLPENLTVKFNNVDFVVNAIDRKGLLLLVPNNAEIGYEIL